MHIDIPQVKTVGQRISRLGSDAESFAQSVDGPMRQAAGSNKGFSALEQLGQVLEALGKQLGSLIKDTGAAGKNVDTAAQTHAANEERAQSSMQSLEQQIPAATPGENLDKQGGEAAPGAAQGGDVAPGGKPAPGEAQQGGEAASGGAAQGGNPLQQVLNPGDQQGEQATDAPPQTDASAPAPDGVNQTKEQFVESVGTAAKAGQEQFGVPASVASAQAILESGWGKSDLATEANNYFGIKCADGDTGPNASSCVNYDTWEVIDGNDTTVNDAFRKYDSASDSFLDHGQFLQDNQRYSEAFNHSDDPDQFIREVGKAGYATDPDYADKIISIMKANDLYRFDN